MSIKIQRVPYLRRSDISHMDTSFLVEKVAHLPSGETALKNISPVPTYIKNYDFDKDLLIDENKPSVIIVASSTRHTIEGYLTASLDWNNCVIIDEFCVDHKHRGKGIGKLLMNEAVRWTVETGLSIIRLETQNTNVPACRFYEKYGFRLGGYDRYLYDAIETQNKREIALFYYLNVQDGNR